jgi:ABC-type transport system involved in multi-copper enzyme maturation permease subunit
LPLVLGLLYALARAMSPASLSPRAIARFAEGVLLNFAFIQIAFTIWLVPAWVATAIAEEKESRTLSFLAMTRLTSAEIVVGKLAAGLVQYAAWLLTALPLAILLPVFGGIDPRAVLLATVVTGSTAYFMGGLSILVSTAASRPADAFGQASGLAILWIVVPVLVQVIVPVSFPRIWAWVQPINDWVLASSPASLLLTVWWFGPSPGWSLSSAIAWMIGLQVAGGSLLVAWAVFRFRNACRRHEETHGSSESAQSFDRPEPRAWAAIRGIGAVRRPPCGDRPILWKELYTRRRRTLAERLSVFVALGFVGLLVYLIFPAALRAFVEQYRYGFDPVGSEVRRLDFNETLRIVTSLIEFFVILATAGIAATGLTEERARETWDSLLATPLTGREIIHAKMIGAAWKVRWAVLLLLALWAVGVLAGSIHPLGFGAAVLLLGASIGFATALGTYASSVSRDSAQASNRALIPVLLLSLSFLVCYLTPRTSSVILGSASAPFVNWLALVSYADVREVIAAQGLQPFRVIRQVGVLTGERPAAVLTAFLLTTVASLAAGVRFSRSAIASFERATGRPRSTVVRSRAQQRQSPSSSSRETRVGPSHRAGGRCCRCPIL